MPIRMAGTGLLDGLHLLAQTSPAAGAEAAQPWRMPNIIESVRGFSRNVHDALTGPLPGTKVVSPDATFTRVPDNTGVTRIMITEPGQVAKPYDPSMGMLSPAQLRTLQLNPMDLIKELNTQRANIGLTRSNAFAADEKLRRDKELAKQKEDAELAGLRIQGNAATTAANINAAAENYRTTTDANTQAANLALQSKQLESSHNLGIAQLRATQEANRNTYQLGERNAKLAEANLEHTKYIDTENLGLKERAFQYQQEQDQLDRLLEAIKQGMGGITQTGQIFNQSLQNALSLGVPRLTY